MRAVRVVVPDEEIGVFEFRQEELPGVAAVNIALAEFEPREVFRWHLSILIELSELADHGMPTPSEQVVVDRFGDALGARLEGSASKPNALFLARITWNRTRELIYRVYDPEIANGVLQEILGSKEYARPFEYRMDDDPEWELTEWHLRPFREPSNSSDEAP